MPWQRYLKASQLRMLALLADDAGTIDALLNDLREKQDSAESTAYARARNDLGDLGGLPTEAIAAIFSDRDYLELGDVRSICAATRNVSDTSRTRLIIGKYGERPITAKPGIVLRSPRLKELHLRDSVINKGELLLAAATRCGDLRKLVLRWNDLDAAAAAADEIAPALEQLSGLQELELDHGGYHTSSAAVMSALARLARLRSLKVNVDRDCAAALASSLPQLTELEDLAICFNRLGDVGASIIGPALAQLRSLGKLDLRDGLSSEKIGPDGGAAISEALRNLTGLRRLHISGFHYDTFFATCFMPAMMVLAAGLTSLHVICKDEPDVSKSMINAAFRGTTNLEELLVYGIDLSLLPLASMANLRSLNLTSDESISPLGGASIASALSKLVHLERLVIDCNEIDPDVRALFVAAVPQGARGHAGPFETPGQLR